MKSAIHPILFLFSFSLMIFSCNSFKLSNDVPPENLPGLTSKLVMSSFISPQDTLLTVMLTESNPLYEDIKSDFLNYVVFNGDTIVFGGGVKLITDATVEISDGLKTFKMDFDPIRKYYSIKPGASSIVIQAGKSYTLTAKSGDRIVSAQCTVPQEFATISLLEVDSLKANFGRFDTDLQLRAKVQWKDIASPNSYYEISGDFKIKTYGVLDSLNFTEMTGDNLYISFGENNIFDDKNFNGTFLPLKTGTAYVYNVRYITDENGNYIPQKVKTDVVSLQLNLLTIDQNYYNYYKTLKTQIQAGDNPFVEPAPVFSNVKGGLGCFGAYQRSLKTVVF